MNKRKTLILTAAAIGFFRALVLAGSKIITKSITTINETINPLTAEMAVSGDTEHTAFEYPYFKMGDIENHMSIENRKCYEFIKLNAEKLWYRNYELLDEAQDSKISYQQIANKGGEIFKYLYGITYHSNYPAMIACYKTNDRTIYLYYLATEEQEDVQSYFRGSYLFLSVDAHTGEILGIDRSLWPITFERNPDINYPTGTELTDEATEILRSQLANDLEIIGRSTDIEYGKIEIAGNKGYYNYYIDYRLPDGVSRYAVYNTVDHINFEMKSILNRRSE